MRIPAPGAGSPPAAPDPDPVLGALGLDDLPDHVREFLAQAPKLTAERLDRIRTLLGPAPVPAPSREHLGGAA